MEDLLKQVLTNMSGLELDDGLVNPIEKCYICQRNIRWGSCLTIHLCYVGGEYKPASIAHTDCVDLNNKECFWGLRS